MNFAPLLQDSTTTTGTGNVTTIGAAVGFQSLTAIGPVGSTFDYTIRMDGSSIFEEGVGTLLSATTFSRAPSGGGAPVSLPAGTKTVTLGPTAARARKWESGTSARVVFTSSLCVSDADLAMDSTTFGTDQAAKLQSLLDLAQTAPLLLVWDGAYSVSTTLKVRSNTTIRVLPNCGAISRSNSNRSIIQNIGRGMAITTPADVNIEIDGGIWNGNGANNGGTNAIDGATFVFDFIAVENIKLRGFEVRKSPKFAVRIANVKKYLVEDFTIDQSVNAVVNSDGVHINGPAASGTIRNGRIYNCFDDSISITSDDSFGAGYDANNRGYSYGPITDLLVDNITIDCKLYGMRLLSGGSLIDRVTFRNIKGKTIGYWLVIDNYTDPSQVVLTGPGNIGTVNIEDISVECPVYGDGSFTTAQAQINCKIGELSISNVSRRDFPTTTSYPSFQLGPKGNIEQWIVHNYRSRSANGGTQALKQFEFLSGSYVNVMKFLGCTFNAPSPVSGYPIVINAGATINQLMGDANTGLGFTDFVLNNGTVNFNHFGSTNNFMDAGTVASTWVLGANVAEVSPSAVTFSPSNVVTSARKAALDSFGGNLQLSARLRFTGTFTSNLSAGLFVRGANTVPWSSAGKRDYNLYADGTPGGTGAFGLYVDKSDGSFTALKSGVGTAVIGTEYDLTVTAKAGVISAKVQRVSDGLYLQANGTWSATNTNFASVTDTTYGASSSEYGADGYAFSTSGIVFTNFTAIAAP